MRRIQKVLMLVAIALMTVAPWSTAQAQDASQKPVTLDLTSVTVKTIFCRGKKTDWS